MKCPPGISSVSISVSSDRPLNDTQYPHSVNHIISDDLFESPETLQKLGENSSILRFWY